MARVVGVSRVCSEQQGSYSNKGIVFYGKLWNRAENVRWYQKERKGRESNRVCGKDEESTGESSGSFKEGVRKYEETSG